MFPHRSDSARFGGTFLCLRRGVSLSLSLLSPPPSFSLPTQRCFFHDFITEINFTLFSAYAEVFLGKRQCVIQSGSFLCLRRGVSPSGGIVLPRFLFSLPTQRCFQHKRKRKPAGVLFSAYAEVFPISFSIEKRPGTFLCLRRGVSQGLVLEAEGPFFSLPTQRCFLFVFHLTPPRLLFSAYAEVFLAPGCYLRSMATFLCLRRGVSSFAFWISSELIFSLPTQRCFQMEVSVVGGGMLFSAYAEVFPIEKTLVESDLAFLCLRRGVSA